MAVRASRSGRPKDAAKRAAIIAAARGLFADHAFDLVTMEAVAARADVSKMTVYSHFHDKETLFETVVSSISDQMMRDLSEPERERGGLRERLTAIGCSFLRLILGSEICRMAHTLPAALRGNQVLARRFYAAGPGRVRAALAAMIAAAASRGELTVDDADWAASDLVSLWENGLPALLAFGLMEPVTSAEIERRARRGTEVFLRAYGTKGNGVTS